MLWISATKTALAVILKHNLFIMGASLGLLKEIVRVYGRYYANLTWIIW